MGIGVGMRGKDLQKFMMVAREFNVHILVRHTNEHSLKYIGQPGYYPKPMVCKAKTADKNPPPLTHLVQGRKTTTQYEVAGLVVHPGFQPHSYEEKKLVKAAHCWEDTMKVLSPSHLHTQVDLRNPASWALWGVERQGVGGSRWSWRIDIDPQSKHFGCLQLKNKDIGWSYIHGDYDLKDVIVPGHMSDNRSWASKLDGVPNSTPLLRDRRFSTIQARLNGLMGADMVQHGSEAQFAGHADEAITVASPNWTHELLTDGVTVQLWYEKEKRKTLGKPGTDFAADKSRWIQLGMGSPPSK